MRIASHATPRETPRFRMLASGMVASVVLHAGLVGMMVRYTPQPPAALASSSPGVTLVLSPWTEKPPPAPPLEQASEQPQPPPPAQPEPALAQQPQEIAPPEPEVAREPEVALGVDDGAKPTENMLGAAVAEENLAPKASVDQPALALDPGAPGTAQQAPPLTPAEESVVPRPAQPHRVEQASTPSTPSTEPREESEAKAAQPRINISTPRPEGDVFAQPVVPAAIAQPQLLATPSEPGVPAQQPTIPREAQSAQPAIEPVPIAPTAPRVAGGDSRLPGARADSESEAFSTAGSLEFRPGTPLAGKGIRIRTVLPRFSITTRLMAVPNNPVIVVRFSRSGKVLSASFEDDKGTGYEDVDVPLLAAVHRWSATGEQLQRIPQGDPKAGLTFKIKYILRE